jgi:N-methylhydantoinase B
MNPIRLEVFKHMLSAVAEEMGAVLRKSSYSPNIKERRDFSCAVFDVRGQIVAQAAHIPVHLGSMPLSVKAAIDKFGENGLVPGDVVILNDPYRGGTHLPDITLVSPVYINENLSNAPVLAGYVANRAHHADVGGMVAGSMPVAREIFQEGLIIPPIKLFTGGQINQDMLEFILANVRTPAERNGDLWAQVAANRRGENRLKDIAQMYGNELLFEAMIELIEYAEKMTRQMISRIPDGKYEFIDFLDDDGVIDDPVQIKVSMLIKGDQALIDFSGSSPQRTGSVNAVYAITLSAVYYVFRCLLDQEIPNNAGLLRPIVLNAPPGTVVNAIQPAPVAGGNVETSQRIVDVLFGALAQALPERIPAASQGTMNNLTIGGSDQQGNPFTYYETISGGMGARPGLNGIDGIHTHMTNTLNTPVEALEYAYPMRVLQYKIRTSSGGKGLYRGGDGIERKIQLLVPAQVTILSDRRKTHPYGLAGGQPGQCGENWRVTRTGEKIQLPGKGSFYMDAGDIVTIQTPGGGGWGIKPDPSNA